MCDCYRDYGELNGKTPLDQSFEEIFSILKENTYVLVLNAESQKMFDRGFPEEFGVENSNNLDNIITAIKTCANAVKKLSEQYGLCSYTLKCVNSLVYSYFSNGIARLVIVHKPKDSDVNDVYSPDFIRSVDEQAKRFVSTLTQKRV